MDNQKQAEASHPHPLPFVEEVEGNAIEGYRVTGKLGQGGMGTTYRAEVEATGEVVALKILDIGALEDWKTFELFEREAQTLKRLDHPGIPWYLGDLRFEDDRGVRFALVQSLAQGRSLAARVEAGWRADEAEARRIAASLLEILSYLQRQSPPVIHRDIKPHNIIMGDHGELSVVDFGAVKDQLKALGGESNTVVGTHGYMAPEQLHGEASAATDLYGLGSTLLHIITGLDPAEIPRARMRLQFDTLVSMSADFKAWLAKLLEPMVEDRFADAQTALDALALKIPSASAKKPDYSQITLIPDSEHGGFTIKLEPTSMIETLIFAAVTSFMGIFFIILSFFPYTVDDSVPLVASFVLAIFTIAGLGAIALSAFFLAGDAQTVVTREGVVRHFKFLHKHLLTTRLINASQNPSAHLNRYKSDPSRGAFMFEVGQSRTMLLRGPITPQEHRWLKGEIEHVWDRRIPSPEDD